MKKLLWPLCVIAILLSAATGGFALAYLTEEVTFDQIKSSEGEDVREILDEIFMEGIYMRGGMDRGWPADRERSGGVSDA